MKKVIFRVKDGVVINSYPSIAEAAIEMHVDESSIRKAAKRGRKCCGYYWTHIPLANPIEHKLPKILILDCETAPIEAYVWKMWKENVSLDQVISDWFMLCWSAKYLFSDIVYSNRLTTKEAIEKDDKRIVTELWKLLDECDIVIAHNGKAFDIPKVKARMIVHGLPPTRPYRQIDTLMAAKYQFGFSSNKLQALAELFGLPSKMDTTFELWAKCMRGDDEALRYMEEYNKQDVIVLEEVYMKLRPWISGHPNMNLYADGVKEERCPNCGSADIYHDGSYYTMVSKYDLFTCKSCGAKSRSRFSSVDKETKKNILLSV